MATRKESQARAQAEEELDAITAEDGEGGGDAPAEGEDQATPETRPEAPAEGGAPAAEQAEAEERTEPEPVPPQQHPEQWQPPDGGQPFRFRADHREVEVPGALEWDHGIYVPKEAWNGVVSRHLADRDALYEQYQNDVGYWQRLAEERDPEKNQQIIQAGLTLQKFHELMELGPAEVAKWLDNYAVNRPLLEAKIREETLQAQLASREQRVNESEFQAVVQATREQLPGFIQGNLEAAISQLPELTELKGSEAQLMEQLWPVAKSFLYEDPQTRQINIDWNVLTPLLQQESRRRKEIKDLQAATKHNQRALGNGKTPPKTVPARGRQVPAGKTQSYKPGETQKARDAFLDWDPLAEED